MDAAIKKQIKENNLSFLPDTPLNYTFSDNTQLIHKASFYNNTDLLLYLINKGIDINTRGGKYSNTPLSFTVYNNCVEACHILLELGADTSLVNNVGLTFPMLCIKFESVLCFILYFVYKNECEDCVDFLLSKTKKYRFRVILRRIQGEKGKYLKEDKIEFKRTNVLIQTENLMCWRFYNVPFLLILLFLMTHYKAPVISLFCLILLIISNRRRFIRSNFYVFINLFYTSFFGYLLLRNNETTIFIILPYFALFMYLIFQKPKSMQNTFEECKILIKDLLKTESYNISQFCYICWIKKEPKTIHCHCCNTCVENLDHHCKFLGTCINHKTKKWFKLYLFLKMILFIIIGSLEMSEQHRLHYKVLFLFVTIQIIQQFDRINKG